MWLIVTGKTWHQEPCGVIRKQKDKCQYSAGLVSTVYKMVPLQMGESSQRPLTSLEMSLQTHPENFLQVIPNPVRLATEKEARWAVCAREELRGEASEL